MIDTDDYTDLRRKLTRAVASVCPAWLSDQAEDIVQVSLMRVMEIRRKSEEDRQFSSSYLWRTAYSALIDEISDAWYPRADRLLELGRRAYESGHRIDPAELNPAYLRQKVARKPPRQQP